MSRNRSIPASRIAPGRIALGLALAVAVVALAPAVHAQEAQTWRVLSIKTRLADAPSYEAALGKLFAAAKKHGMKTPVFASTSTSEPGTYVFASPFAGMGDLDAFGEAWNEIYASVPDVIQALNEAAISSDVQIFVGRPDLSFAPAKPRYTAEEAPFSRIVWLRPHPDQVAALEGIFAEFGALSKKHGDDLGYNVFQQTIGADGPVYGVMNRNTTQSALFAAGEKQQEKWGSDWTNAIAKMSPMMRNISYSSSMARPDLSYQP